MHHEHVIKHLIQMPGKFSKYKDDQIQPTMAHPLYNEIVFNFFKKNE